MAGPKISPSPSSGPPPNGTPVLPKQNDGCTFWVLLVLFILVVFVIGQFSGTSNNSAAPQTEAAQQAITTAIQAQSTQTVEPLNRANIRIGLAHLKLAAKAEALAGEMIYSQNCYDALGKHFAWPKLDQCGAFDVGAAQSLGDDAPLTDKEATWFQSEVAAGRYLKAAIAAGEVADRADIRLSDLQAAVKAGHPAGFKGSQPGASEAASDETVKNGM